MTNEEQLAILRDAIARNEISIWNNWRIKNRTVPIHLSNANLREANLGGADLSNANLREANLKETNLTGAFLNWADLTGAILTGAILNGGNLQGAHLNGADLNDASIRGAYFSESHLNEVTLREAALYGAHLYKADLTGAILTGAHLTGAELNETDLTGAYLNWADLTGAILTGGNLAGADFSHAILGETHLASVDLRPVKGLETVRHLRPSEISFSTFYKSGGEIPEAFLRGAGVPETMITFMGSLVGKPIQFYSTFISYSTRDDDFAHRLHADLQEKGVRVWFAPEDLKIGDKFRSRIDEAIRIYDKLMVVLSENSINSTWVEKEVETAFEKEHRENRIVLFPIRLDDAVMNTDQSWAADIRRTRHIGDFRRWKDHDDYQKAFTRLLRDLKAEPEKAGA